MDRDEAADALKLLRRVAAKARDDTAVQNWGLIWLFSGASNGAGFMGTHVFMSRGDLRPLRYVILWSVVFALNGLWIALFKKKASGAPSFFERQLWSLWNVLILAMAATALVNYVLGLSVMMFVPPVCCILAAMTFATMGSLMGRWWYALAALWGATAFVTAAMPRAQFALFAVLWALTQSGAGALLHRAKLASEREARAGG